MPPVCKEKNSKILLNKGAEVKVFEFYQNNHDLQSLFANFIIFVT